MSLTETITLPNGNKYEQPTGLFIGGEFVKSVDGKTFETINPSTEKPICSVQEASEKDVDIAVLVEAIDITSYIHTDAHFQLHCSQDIRGRMAQRFVWQHMLSTFPVC